MKQTNNAIKFLMAQYRAIYKHAYLKGILTASVLTLGLGASVAQASNNVTFEGIEEGDKHFITGSSSNQTKQNHWILNIDGTSGAGRENNKSFEIIVTGQDSSLTNTIKGKVSAKNATLTIDTDQTPSGITGTDAASLTISGSGSATNKTEVTFGTLNVKKGTLTLQADNAENGDVNLYSDNITIGGLGLDTDKATAVVEVKGSTETATASAILGNKPEDSASGSIINIDKGGIVKLIGTTSSGDAQVLGQTLTIKKDGLLVAGDNSTIDLPELKVESGGFLVISGASTFKGASGSVAGNLLVEDGKSLTMTLDNVTNTDGSTKPGEVTIAKGSNVQLKGSLNVEQGTLTVQNGAGLYALSGSSSSGSIIINAKKNYPTTERDKNSPSLKILSSDLVKFLKGGEKYKAITYTDGDNKIEIAQTDSTSVAGGLVLSSGAKLELQDTEQLDISQVFRFAAGSDTASAGTISIGQSGAIISGKDILVSSVLKSGTDSNLSSTANLYIEANKLTLGSANTGETDFKIKSAQAKDSLTLVTKNNAAFTLKNDIVLSRDFYQKDSQGINLANPVNGSALENTTHGKVLGADINISGSAAQNFTVEGGYWETNGQNISVGQSGALSVTASAMTPLNSKNVNNGNSTYFAMNGGELNISSASNSKATVNVSGSKGANATFDLSKANVSFGTSGEISISGDLANINSSGDFADEEAAQKFFANSFKDKVGYGNLILNERSFNNFMDKNEGVTLSIKSGGILTLSDSVTSSYDVQKFTTTAIAGKVAFTGAGYFITDGSLNLYTGKKTTGEVGGETENKALDIGDGTIIANSIRINNFAQDTEGNKLDTKVTGGMFEVSQEFSTTGSNLLLGATDSTKDTQLVLDAGTGSGNLTIGANGLGTIKFTATTTNTSGSSLSVNGGSWTTNADLEIISAKNGSTILTVGVANPDLNDPVAKFAADNLSVKAQNVQVAQINQGSEAVFNTAQLVSGDAIDVNNGHFVINGLQIPVAGSSETDHPLADYSATAGVSLANAKITVTGNQGVFEFGNVATNALIDLDGNKDATEGSSKILITAGGIDTTKFEASKYGKIKFNFDANTALSKEDVKLLVNKFLADSKNSGYLYLENADLGLTPVKREDGKIEYTWDEVKDFVNVIGSKATIDSLAKALVSKINNTDQIQGHYGALAVGDDYDKDRKITVVGHTSLGNASDFGGYFASKTTNGKQEAVGVSLTNDASLSLQNGGIIGSIEGNGNKTQEDDENALFISGEKLTHVQGSITRIGDFEAQGEILVDGEVQVDTLLLNSKLSNQAHKEGNTSARYVNIDSAGQLLTKNLVLGKGTTQEESVVLGSVNAENVELYNSALNVFGGTVISDKISLDANSEILVGYEKGSTSVDNKDTIYNETLNYTGFLQAQKLELNQGFMAVDPIYGDHTAFVSVNNLSGAIANVDKDIKAGTLDGQVYVGQNAVLGVGSANLDELKKIIAPYQNGHTLDGNKYGSILYLGKQINVIEQGGLTLTSLGYEKFLEDLTARKSPYQYSDENPVLANTMFFGKNTAILVDASVANYSASNAEKQGMIHFNTNDATIIADGGEVLVQGNVRANNKIYTLFSDNNGSVDMKNVAGQEYSTSGDEAIQVTTSNNFLQGVVEKDGTFTLHVNADRSVLYGASDPVYKSLVAYARGYNGDDVNDVIYDGYIKDNTPKTGAEQGAEGDKPSSTPTEVKNTNYSNYFLDQVIATGNGSDAEQVARLGVYGGVVQSAMLSSSTTNEVISSRMGMGAQQGSLSFADNGQGAGLWVAPIYKNNESDGFAAQGLKYGVDMDIFGLALGADYTMNNGLRMGLMFNVGSGDADGKQAAQGVKNDFDYYGFAAYAGYSMNKFSLVADLSYTVADNEITANTSIDKVGAKLDSTALSLGVTGQYTLALNGLDVTPHAGIRFTSIDLDDYIIDGEEHIAHYAADRLNVFSIPVGITVSKDIVAGSWTVKPSFDLTLTGNFGDDEAKGNVDWGLDNFNTDVNTEVFDNFVYGASLGVAAKSGNLSFGLGLNYAGSSNTDEYGVNANARFVF